MTLIIGARCSDGVVMVADRKITVIWANGSVEYKYGTKLFGILYHVILGSSGNTGMFNLFKSRCMEYVDSHNVPIQYVISRLCDITKRTNEEYGMRYDTSFDVLVAIQYKDKDSELTYITKRGEPHNEGYCYTVGSGAGYARVYLNEIDTRIMRMREFVHIAYFIIRYVEGVNLDASVGVGPNSPHIWYIPDRYTEDEHGTHNIDIEETNFEDFERESRKRIIRHKKQLRSLFRGILG